MENSLRISKARKTDIQDCQWIQKLHSIGLLSGSFFTGRSDRTTSDLLQAQSESA